MTSSDSSHLHIDKQHAERDFYNANNMVVHQYITTSGELPRNTISQTRVYNAPPDINLTHFQNRHSETKVIGNFLRDASKYLLFVYGPHGVGKTASVYFVLKSLEANGQMPNRGEQLDVDAIFYENAYRSKPITSYSIYSSLCKLLTSPYREIQLEKWNDPSKTSKEKIEDVLKVLQRFPVKRLVLVLDNFEEMIDFRTKEIDDTDLCHTLRTFIHFSSEQGTHPLKVIIISAEQHIPEPVRDAQAAERVQLLPMQEGLELPLAENYLQALDEQNTSGLSSSKILLDIALVFTKGYPRALLALHQVKILDQNADFDDIWNSVKKGEGYDITKDDINYVMKALVGKAIDHLQPNTIKVLQALAIYDFPASADAVRFLLHTHLPVEDRANIETILHYLVEKKFVFRQGNAYELSQSDKIYVQQLTDLGSPLDGLTQETPPFTFFALAFRGVKYLAEIAHDYDAACYLLIDMDNLLFLFGAYELIRSHYEALYNKVINPFLKTVVGLHIGIACMKMGNYQEGFSWYKKAEQNAQITKNDDIQAMLLYNIGTYFYRIGHINNAIKYFAETISIASKTNRKTEEWYASCNLGHCHYQIGNTKKALEHYQHLLTLTRRSSGIEKKTRVASIQVCLGHCYSLQGFVSQALQSYKQVLATYDEAVMMKHFALQDELEFIRGTALQGIAEVLTDQSYYSHAIQHASEGAQIARERKNGQLGSENNSILALSYLCMGKIFEAYSAVKEALAYTFPENNHYASVLLGIIERLLGNDAAATIAFRHALEYADEILSQDKRIFHALDTKVLALCGLALCQDHDYLPKAIEVYQESRVINKEEGVVKRVKRLLGLLTLTQSEKEFIAEILNML